MAAGTTVRGVGLTLWPRWNCKLSPVNSELAVNVHSVWVVPRKLRCYLGLVPRGVRLCNGDHGFLVLICQALALRGYEPASASISAAEMDISS